MVAFQILYLNFVIIILDTALPFINHVHKSCSSSFSVFRFTRDIASVNQNTARRFTVGSRKAIENRAISSLLRLSLEKRLNWIVHLLLYVRGGSGGGKLLIVNNASITRSSNRFFPRFSPTTTYNHSLEWQGIWKCSIFVPEK